MIAFPSVASLLVVPLANGEQLGTATAFVVKHEQEHYLITNYHVASGWNAITGEALHARGGIPDTLRVSHVMDYGEQNEYGTFWEDFEEPLLKSDGSARWLWHPTFGRRVDVVALPLTDYGSVLLHPYDFEIDPEAPGIGPTSTVSIIGFPFGATAGGRFAIWTKGSVASEPEVDFDDLPCFLVDASTYKGQSGSPVLSYYPRGAVVARPDRLGVYYDEPHLGLHGVYSGKIDDRSQIGRVWKSQAVREILAAQQSGNALYFA